VHAHQCGGCPILSLSYPEQLARKRSRVVGAMSRYPSLELAYTESVLPAVPTTGYRTRAKLMIAPGGRMGLFAKGGGHHVVDIEHCRVLAPELMKVAQMLREAIRADEARGGILCAREAGGALRAVDLREVRAKQSGVLMTWVVSSSADRAVLVQRAQAMHAENPSLLGIALNLHDGESPQVLGPVTEPIAGVRAAADQIGTAQHQATYGSFVQAHRGQAARVHELLCDAFALETRSGLRVLDLYGGSGAIALAMAKAGAEVHMIESFAPAVAHAREAAKQQELTLTCECGDAGTLLQRLATEARTFDCAVVNPPRRGMSPDARRALAELGPKAIAYVSCDPETLARDLDHFARLGYMGTTLQPLDMIPLTDEVETVALLRKVSAALPRVLMSFDGIVVIEKGAHELVEGPASHSIESRLKSVHPEARLLTKIDGGASGVVVFAIDTEAQIQWAPSFAESRTVYFASVRGITPSKGSIARDLRERSGVRAARTRYRRLAVSGGHSVLRVIPDENLMHQVRRHMAAIGHAVLGDTRYGHEPTNRFFEEKNALDRPFLHAVRIEVSHPVSKIRLQLEAPLAGDLRATLDRMGGPGTVRLLDQKQALGSGSLPPAGPDSSSSAGGIVDLDVSPESMRPPILSDDERGER
jgi:23S rRNA (uracil1939-C5)-methyltransferase